MTPFSEEEQAERRRPLLRSPKGRRIAAYAALPLGVYAALAAVSLLGGPRIPLVPVPGPDAADAIPPVVGPPSVGSSERPHFPAIPPDPTAAVPTPVPSSTPTPSGGPTAPRYSEDAADRPGGVVVTPGDRGTTRPSPRPVDERTGPPIPRATKTPPVPPGTEPPPTVPPQPPGTPGNPGTPGSPGTPGPPDDPGPRTLGEALLALLNALTP